MIVNPPLRLISGTSNPVLANSIASYLNIPLCNVKISQFSDGEIYAQLLESVRGSEVFILQSTNYPVHHNLMELLILIDACKRASAKEITAVIPYFGYARQDRQTAGREAISAKLVADILCTAGADRVISVDFHTAQMQAFFNIVTDNLSAMPILVDYIASKKLTDMVIVSPDIGGVARARNLARKFNAPIAIIDKRRLEHNKAEVANVIGEIEEKSCIIVDDMVDTAGTLTAGVDLLLKNGAKEVYATCTHGVLSGPAIDRISASKLKELIITDTIALTENKKNDKITTLSIAPILGEAIKRIYEGASVSTLFD